MKPELLVVVDTEEEFDWSKPFSRESVATRSIPAQGRAHDVYERFGLVPTYVIDFPVATDPDAVRFLRALKEAGKAEIGAHLHPWVNPPHEEEVTPFNSYHCNLPPALERAKLNALTEAIETGFGERPTIFKAGRYGFGPNTGKVLVELGYQVDCSVVPHTDFSADGGPDFRGRLDVPHWIDEGAGLLEVPLTTGYFGAMAGLGGRAAWLFDDARAEALRVPGLLSKAGLVTRSRLSPEGVSAAEQCRLIEAMAGQGHRLFCLTYHSPSLEPGHTPYVRTEADLDRFLSAIETVLAFFRDEMDGRFTTLTEVRRNYPRKQMVA